MDKYLKPHLLNLRLDFPDFVLWVFSLFEQFLSFFSKLIDSVKIEILSLGVGFPIFYHKLCDPASQTEESKAAKGCYPDNKQ